MVFLHVCGHDARWILLQPRPVPFVVGALDTPPNTFSASKPCLVN
jgi:hypothetical protein